MVKFNCISWQKISDNYLYILNENNEEEITLGGLSVYIWDLFIKNCAKEDIVKKIYDEYEVEENQIVNDLEEFILALRGVDMYE